MKELIEQLKQIIKVNEEIKFDDSLDVKKLFDEFKMRNMHSFDLDELEKFKEFIGYTPEMDNEQLRAKRNSIVRYYSDIQPYGNGGEFDAVLADQMSAFTGMIDYLMMQDKGDI